jgi:hypothetical protein
VNIVNMAKRERLNKNVSVSFLSRTDKKDIGALVIKPRSGTRYVTNYQYDYEY